jgi:hypothetical protein
VAGAVRRAEHDDEQIERVLLLQPGPDVGDLLGRGDGRLAHLLQGCRRLRPVLFASQLALAEA